MRTLDLWKILEFMRDNNALTPHTRSLDILDAVHVGWQKFTIDAIVELMTKESEEHRALTLAFLKDARLTFLQAMGPKSVQIMNRKIFDLCNQFNAWLAEIEKHVQAVVDKEPEKEAGNAKDG